MIRILVGMKLLIIIQGVVLITSATTNGVYLSEGELRIGLIFNECSTNTTTVSNYYVTSTVWITERLNLLNSTTPLRLALSVFQVCTENDYYDSIYKLFKHKRDSFFLGALTNKEISRNVGEFAKLLGVNIQITHNYKKSLLETTIRFLTTFESNEHLAVYAESQDVLNEVFELTKNECLCIKRAVIFNKLEKYKKQLGGTVVVLGKHETLNGLIKVFDEHFKEVKAIFVPFDWFEIVDFPEGSYVIHPNYSLETKNYSTFIPSPLIFDLASPILNLVIGVLDFIEKNCNETVYKLNCLHNKHKQHLNPYQQEFSPFEIKNLLKLDEFSDDFNYNIYRIENLTLQNCTQRDQSYVNILTYNIFNHTSDNYIFNLNDTKNLCSTSKLNDCVNVELIKNNPSTNTILISYAFSQFNLRTESWIYAFLSISFLGILFCTAILIFLMVRFCKRDTLEGNQFLTILLLFSTMLIYLAVIPFALDTEKELKKTICLTRAFSSILPYAFTFSLLLSRSILLATTTKEIGFLSHISGPVQSFLTLFIFAVQAALILQFVNRCEFIFNGVSFVYLMSYNVILLILLLFISPINIRVERNYKEGRHFMIAVVLFAITWSCWIPAHLILDEKWKDPLMCLGLVTTASIVLGAIYIPRTYMMMMAAARDSLASNVLPSLPAASSILDVYRASTQPVYDCINIAAINAATLARNSIPLPPPQPDVYSNIATPYEDEYDFDRSITPTNTDKVTRF